MTTAGGWGVVTADAIAGPATSSCCRCPTTCATRSTQQLPPRWSRNNPIDLAGGETQRHDPDGARADRRATPTSTPS